MLNAIMWFTETPWPPIFIISLLAAALLAVWYSRQQTKYLIGVGLLVVAAVATFFIEREIVTDSELIEQNVIDLVSAFQRKDGDATAAFFSPQAAQKQALVLVAMSIVDAQPDLDVKDLSVRMVASNSRGIAQFRANGTISVPMFSVVNHAAATRWRVTWQKEAGEWKIVDIRQLDLLRDEEARDKWMDRVPAVRP